MFRGVFTLQYLRISTFIVLLSVAFAGKAQEHEGEVWLAYIGSISVGQKWRIWHDYQFANRAFLLIRPGITYLGRADIHWTAGYAYVRTTAPGGDRINRPEHRPWAQAVKNFDLHPRWRYQIRLRYDARFRADLDVNQQPVRDACSFNHRHRVMQQLRYTIKNYPNGSQLHADLMNEVLVNSGRKIDFGLDQLRTFALAGYSTQSLTILTGYHQRFFPDRGNGSRFRHGLTFWVIHRLPIPKAVEVPEDSF